jgi:hypothetical protein
VTLWAEENKAPKGSKRRSAFQQWLRGMTNSMRHRRKMARRDATSARADIMRHRVLDLTGRFDARP